MKQRGNRKDKDEAEKESPAEANLVDSDSSTDNSSNTSPASNDVTVLLAFTMNLVSNNDTVWDQIAEALNLLADE